MKRFHLSLFVMAALSGASILGMPSQAHAGFLFSVRIKLDGNDVTTIADGVSPDSNSTPGVIGITNLLVSAGASGSYFVNVTATASPQIGTTSDPAMSLMFNVTGTSTSSHTITILASEIGTNGPPATFFNSTGKNNPPFPLAMSISPNGTQTDSSVTYSAGLSTSQMFDNSQGGATISSISGSPTTLSPNSGFSQAYSLEQIVTVNFSTGTDAASGTANLGDVPAVAPAPPALVLVLSGLPFLGLGQWLRRRRVATVA